MSAFGILGSFDALSLGAQKMARTEEKNFCTSESKRFAQFVPFLHEIEMRGLNGKQDPEKRKTRYKHMQKIIPP